MTQNKGEDAAFTARDDFQRAVGGYKAHVHHGCPVLRRVFSLDPGATCQHCLKVMPYRNSLSPETLEILGHKPVGFGGFPDHA